MAQQINLLAPILLTPKRYFSATTLVQATAVLLVAAVAMASYVQWADQRAGRAHVEQLAQLDQERQALAVAVASQPAPADEAVLAQQLKALQKRNADQELVLRALAGIGDGEFKHSELLSLLSRTVPEGTWLSELSWHAGRLEIKGGTVDTKTLRPWWARLTTHPLLANQTLQSLRVEHINAPEADTAKRLLQGGGTERGPLVSGALAETLRNARQPVWLFEAVSGPQQAASSAASGAAP
jgi:Tfp pilus assembly protein PilN